MKLETELTLQNIFEFNISWENFTDKILKHFGLQDLNIGYEAFDKKYLIRSDKPELAKGMLNYKHLANKILKLNLYLVALNYFPKQGKHRLLIVKDRFTDDYKILRETVEVLFSILDYLEKKRLT